MQRLIARSLALPCGAVLTNRLAKAAMTEGLANADDQATRAHELLYRRWSLGGAGLLITGNVMVDRRYLERPGNVVIDGNGGHEALRRWARAGTEGGNHLWMQISHPGRQATRMSTSHPVSASAVGLKLMGMFARPRALTAAEIRDVIHRFAETAQVARDTGFTGVQVHAAHGYLLSQFLSPITNHRQDEWGGSLLNRARLLREVVAAVRARVGGDFPLAVKLNSADFQRGGFQPEDCVQVANWLEQDGVDLLEVSGGTYEQPRLLGHSGRAETSETPRRRSTRQREAYFLDYAAMVRSATRLPLMVTGGFRSAQAMEDALGGDELDVVGIARPLCVDVDLPSHLLDGTVDAAISYETALPFRSRLFGPASPLMLLKFINVQGEMAWFYRQMLRLSQGQAPARGLSLLGALAQHLLRELHLARRRRFHRA